MEAFFMPILFAVAKKATAALLMITFWFISLRVADRFLGINFKAEWDDVSDDKAKVSYWNTRMIAFAVMFLGCFAFV